MAENDLEPKRPRATAPDRRPGLAFSQVMTLALSLVLISVLACLSQPASDNARLAQMERPVETAERVLERDLWIEDALATFPDWTRDVAGALADLGPSAREEAIRAFAKLLETSGRPMLALETATPVDPRTLDGLRARRTVLLADADRIEEAEGDMQMLVTAGQGSFVDAVKRAWSRVRSDDTRSFADYDVAIAGEDWIGQHLRYRLAVATRSEDVRAALERDILARRADVAVRLRRVLLAELVPLIAGFLVLLAWIARNRPAGVTSTAEIPPPWAFQFGYAVVVRSAFGAIAIGFVLMQSAVWLDHSGRTTWAAMLTVWGTLIVALPMVWFVRRRLLALTGQSFRATFGLAAFPRPVWWIGFTLAVFAVEQLGAHAIVDAFRMGGIGLRWSDEFVPFAIFEPKSLVIASAVDACVWGPFFGEIGFRGLLYATLRRHYGPWQAAILSAAVFGAAHLSSMPELVSLTWTGLVFAVAFERCRSLVPGMVCAAWAGVFSIAATVWLYR
jgi:membrane protease YdiL (CAAX protease family)